jgi:enoyl-CoA hydratase
MAYQFITLETSNRISVLTLNRPNANNALNRALTLELIDAINAADASEETAVIVITGAGKAFCAGVDLSELNDDSSVLTDEGLGTESPLSVAMRTCKKPIIGAVNGAAVTGGFELALGCDFLYASERARFADTHVRVGILPGWGLSQKLSRIIGLGRAKELSLSGNFISAQEAFRLGLVNKICSSDELIPEAITTAQQIAESELTMVMAYKALIDDGYDSAFGEALKLEDERSTRWAQDVDYSVMAERLAQLRSRASKQR